MFLVTKSLLISRNGDPTYHFNERVIRNFSKQHSTEILQFQDIEIVNISKACQYQFGVNKIF